MRHRGDYEMTMTTTRDDDYDDDRDAIHPPPSSNDRRRHRPATAAADGGRDVVVAAVATATVGLGRRRDEPARGLAVRTSLSSTGTESDVTSNNGDIGRRRRVGDGDADGGDGDGGGGGARRDRLRQEVLRSIFGRGYRVDRPTLCPNCRGDLTYIYVSSTVRTSIGSPPCVSAINVDDGADSARSILQHLLPPVCKVCRTHYLFEGTEMKFLMMENFNSWIDGCRRESSDLEGGDDDDDDDDDDDRNDDDRDDRYREGDGKGGRGRDNARAGGTYDYNDPRHAKIVIVGCPPTPVHQPNETSATPRRDNGRRGDRDSYFFRGINDDDDDDGVGGRTMLTTTSDQQSTFSTGTNKTYRRKGELDYERNNNGTNTEREERTQRTVDDEKREDDATGTIDEDATTRAFDGKYFSFDEDPFASDDSGDGRERIQLIRTASEERMILEHYSMK